MFELKNVTFKHILHIQHVCLDRCVTCITGPSGSGKTTMLRLLNRLNEADGGIDYVLEVHRQCAFYRVANVESQKIKYSVE